MIVFVLSVFVLSFTAIILPAVFTWLTSKDVPDEAYCKGYEKGYRRAIHEGYEKGYKDGKAAGMKSTTMKSTTVEVKS